MPRSGIRVSESERGLETLADNGLFYGVRSPVLECTVGHHPPTPAISDASTNSSGSVLEAELSAVPLPSFQEGDPGQMAR
jgi:hypothetical protein